MTFQVGERVRFDPGFYDTVDSYRGKEGTVQYRDGRRYKVKLDKPVSAGVPVVSASEEQLEALYTPVTEAELAEVYKSLGVMPEEGTS